MHSIINGIFFEDLGKRYHDSDSADRKIKEEEGYQKLLKTLNGEQRNVFMEYIELHNASQADDEMEHYRHGFQSGVLLMLEVLGAKI